LRAAPTASHCSRAGDRYEILPTHGTNGWNYGIGPDSIVACCGRSNVTSVRLTGMGFDWWRVAPLAIGDAEALARRFYAFCPDVRGSGNGTVDAIARDLGESQRLYCWWD